MGRYSVIAAITILFAASVPCNAQVVSNYSPNEELFNYEVKLIDEFIERFNDAPSAYIRTVYREKKKPFNVTRKMLLASLFNLENTRLTADPGLNGFFQQVLDEAHPVYLSFTDSDWYAEARGIFLYNGKQAEIPLVLHIKSHGDDWSKWMITGIGNTTPNDDPQPSISISKPAKRPATAYISTSSYATDFVELHYIFTSNFTAENFLEPALLESNKGKQFVASINNGALKFLYVKSMKFHFYQVKDWIFTVEHFSRKSYNSGWLINDAQKVSEAEKNVARKKLLNR
jgi:hypothetical protein